MRVFNSSVLKSNPVCELSVVEDEAAIRRPIVGDVVLRGLDRFSGPKFVYDVAGWRGKRASITAASDWQEAEEN